MSPEAPKPKATPKSKTKAAPKPKATRARRPPPIRLDRLRAGEAISLVAAVLLFVLMFLTWYGSEAGLGGPPSNLVGYLSYVKGGNAWQALAVIPLFLMLAISVAIGAALLRLGDSPWKPTIPAGAAVCVLGGLAALLILIRILVPPDRGGAIEGFTPKANLQVAIFLALAAALGIAYGGWRTMRDEGTSFDQIAKKLESPRRPAKPRTAPASKSSPRPKP